MPGSSVYDTTFGTLLIATWINTLLYTLEVSQVRVYFKYHVQQDPFLVRTMVKVCLFCDFACLIAEYACVYLYAVTHWGDEEYLLIQDWPIPAYVMTSSISALVVQFFLIRRYFHLARDVDGPWKLICMAIFSLATFGSAYAVAVVIILRKTYTSRLSMTVPVIVWLSASAATDWSIALSLIYRLRQMRSEFKSSAGIVQRITYITIQTGTATSVLALTMLFVHLQSKTTNIATLFGFCFGTTYSLTMLHNLNRRHTLAARQSGTIRQSRPGNLETGSLGVGFSALRPPNSLNNDGADPATTARSYHPAMPSPLRDALTASSSTETSARTFEKLEAGDVVVSQLLDADRPVVHHISIDSSVIARQDSEVNGKEQSRRSKDQQQQQL